MIFKIEIPVYNSFIWVYVEESTESILKHVKKIYGRNAPDDLFDLDEYTDARVVIYNGCPRAVIFKGDVTPPIVSHEMLHVVCSLLNNRGLRFSEDSEEAFCYLLGYLVKEFYKKIKINLEDEKILHIFEPI